MNPSRIHVYCRLRSIEENENGSVRSFQPSDPSENYMALSVLDRSNVFAVDKLFDNQTQSTIFQESLEPLIDDVFRGINCTVFTYGQTGSGKTHTIIGGHDEQNQGLLPRAIDNIFQRINSINKDASSTSSSLFSFTVRVSILEIYHEKLRDLLSVAKNEQNLAIRENSDGTIWVENLLEQKIENPYEYSKLLQQALKRRVVGSHNMNDQSSRSHLCCLINLVCSDKKNQRELQSKLSLIDLAGSEMAKKTEAKGQRFEEAKFINKSLSALSKVIHALSTQQHNESSHLQGSSLKLSTNTLHNTTHIPYRDSKLTRLLQHSLSGNAKTVIFLTISNSLQHVAETISTLKFGERARLVLTKPKINIETGTNNQTLAKIEGYQNEIQEYQCLVEQLQSQVLSMQRIIQDLQQENMDLQNNQKHCLPAIPSICMKCQDNSSFPKDNECVGSVEFQLKNYIQKMTLPIANESGMEYNINEESDEKNMGVEKEEENDVENQDDGEDEEFSDRCGICGLNQVESDRLSDTTGENLGFFFHCDGNCGSMFHVRCVGLIGDAGQYVLPEGEWFCLSCQHDLDVSHRESLESSPIGESNSDNSIEELSLPVSQHELCEVKCTTSKMQTSIAISPSKQSLSVVQQELRMSQRWQQQYDIIRKDRNRILLQWQQDQDNFRIHQEKRQKQQEERETYILQVEDQRLELTQALSKQQEENLTLKSCIQELQVRCAALQTQLFDDSHSRTAVSVTATSLESLSALMMPKSNYSAEDNDSSLEITPQDTSPQTLTKCHQEHNTEKSRNKRYHRYDAAEDVVEEINSDTHTSLSIAEIGGYDGSGDIFLKKRKGQESLPPTRAMVKHHNKAMNDILSSTLPKTFSSDNNNNSQGIYRKSTSSATSLTTTNQLTRSNSDNVSTENLNYNSTSASRFVNPLRNRLSELLAQADEEKESFVELRMKLQSRSETRASYNKS